jgi:hypothetical protein
MKSIVLQDTYGKTLSILLEEKMKTLVLLEVAEKKLSFDINNSKLRLTKVMPDETEVLIGLWSTEHLMQEMESKDD